MKTSCCHSTRIQRIGREYICLNTGCVNYRCSTIRLRAAWFNRTVFAGFFLFFTIVSFNDFSSNNHNRLSEIHAMGKDGITRPLNAENLRAALDECHIICPEQVYAQVMIESGNLNSYLAKKTNNILGMRYPFKRKTTAIGIYIPAENLIVKGGQTELKRYKKFQTYAVYNSWEDCIKDYKFWQEKSFNLENIYLEFLSDLYAEDSAYVKKIRQITR